MPVINFGTRWHKVVKEILEETEFPSKPKILDVGGGKGVFKQFIPDSDYFVIDADDDALREAKRNGCNIIKQDLNKLPIKIKNNIFDMILALEVFEHVIYPESLLKEIRRLMKPAGIGVFSLPNFFNLGSRARILFNKYEGFNIRDYDGREVQLFNLDNAKDFISSEFKIIKTKYSWLGSRYLKIFPVLFKRFLASKYPNLFAESIVVLVKKKR